MAIITVVLGVIFVLLMLSLLATTIMELIASFLHLRGRNLVRALSNLLVGMKSDGTTPEDAVFQAFKNNPLYKQMGSRYWPRSDAPPSYLEAQTFQSILFDILLGQDDLESQILEKIEALENEDLKRVLLQLYRDSDHNIETFKLKIENWYNNVMDRAGGWYKRNVQKILILVGLCIAVILNADTLSIYERLESDPATLQKVVDMAEQFVASNEDADFQQQQEAARSIEELTVELEKRIDYARSPLGLGWKNVDLYTSSPYDWVTKVLGWIVTALAISLGAPFWFDILKKLVNIRSSGNKPAEK